MLVYIPKYYEMILLRFMVSARNKRLLPQLVFVPLPFVLLIC